MESILDLNAYVEFLCPGSRERYCENLSKHNEITTHIADNVGTITLEYNNSILLDLLEVFLQELLWEKSIQNSQNNTMDIIRMKGVIHVKDDPNRMLIQC